MRIAFLVPGHQSGHCGVTDYSFWIIAAAIEQGATVCVLSLYRFPSGDYIRRIPETFRGRLVIHQPSERNAIPAQLATALQNFAPDHAIIQFSPPAFRKGRLLYPYLSEVFRVFRPFKVSLMIHETWLRPGEPASLRSFILRQLRRGEILMALRLLRAPQLYVSNQLHQTALIQAGFHPRLLPLFSNIPGGPRPAHTAQDMIRVLDSLGVDGADICRAGTTPRFALFFARISPEWNPTQLLLRLREEVSPDGPLVLLSVGETGYSNQGWERIIKTAQTVRCIRLGPQSPEIIRRLLHLTDYGLCPTPLAYWMKSSACAAMVACETPMVFAEDHVPDEGPLPPHFATLAQTGLAWHRPGPDRIARPATPASIWKQICEDASLPSC